MNLRDMFLCKNFGPQNSGGGDSGDGVPSYWKDLWQGAETVSSDDTVTFLPVGDFRKYLKRFDFPNGYAPGYFFQNATALEFLRLKGVHSLSYYLCQKCTALTYADIGTIGYWGGWMFDGCTSLEVVKCKPTAGCHSIYSNQFANCKKLVTMVVDCEAVPAIHADAFASTPIAPSGTATDIAYGTGYIYVRKAVIEEFKVATNWVTYADRFRAIEDYPDICGEVTA